ncbi:protein FAM161B [Aplochiton taeniatus]
MSAASMQEQRNMADLQAFLEKGLISEQQLQQRLQALKEAHRQQLMDGERRQREGLEKRMQLNSLLSQTEKDGRSSSERHLEEFFNQDRDIWEGVRYHSTPFPHHSQGHYNRNPGGDHTLPTHLRKEAESEAECARKFRAAPVPSHVFLPLYESLIQAKEAERKVGVDQRKSQLLAMQKPFSFQHREEEKREELLKRLSVVVQKDKPSIRKSVPKAVTDSTVCEGLQELCRKLCIQARAQETLRSSIAPVGPVRAGPRSSQRRTERLGFLDERPTFKPRTSSQVPDFSRLHRALQTEALRRSEAQDGTKCQPFNLRTSSLPLRQKAWPSHSSSSGLKRSLSVGGLMSLSTHTLPTYITDAARKRCTAIRKSVEQRESQVQESAEWRRRHQNRSQALSGAIAIRAKVLDPHSSLEEVGPLKLKQHREADQQRMKEYKKELQEMKERVTARPYLFEQVTQKNAKTAVERTYRNKLQDAGLNERFVETNGEGCVDSRDVQG